jgi:hypothetical protein
MAAPTASVVAQASYNGYVQLKCNLSICTGQLPLVRATERLVVQFISCLADVSKESVFRHFYVQLTDSKVTRSRGLHFLPATYHSDRSMQTVVVGLGQPITLAVEPDSMVHFGASAIGQFGDARCTVAGVKQTLG